MSILKLKDMFKLLSCEIILIAMTILITMALTNRSNQNKPTAIDVYRGNTTLKITYVDSVTVDSIVVFKTNNE